MEAILCSDPGPIAQCVQRISRLLSIVYGAELNGLVDRVTYVASVPTSVTSMRLVYLVCLDAEPSMQRYERSINAGKYAVFAPSLRQHTEDLFDLRISAHQYVEACCNDYVLA